MSGYSTRQAFTDRQLAIYTRQNPSAVPVNLTALEDRAKHMLDPAAFDYVAGGAASEDTMRANLEAFRRWRIVPRMLRNVSDRNLSLELLGLHLPAPVILGPVGVQAIIHPTGELSTARASASLALPFVLSTVSSHSMEQVAELTPAAPRWFQLYPSKNSELNASLLNRAEAAGYSAIVVTLDTRLLGWRDRDLDRAYLPFLQGLGLANYVSDPVFRAGLAVPPEQDPAAAIRSWAALNSQPSSTWENLGELRRQTRLPILVKGLLHPDDARHALDHGVNGIIVSNHGGRQVDGAIAALDALPAIVKAVANNAPILFDSGIRRGSDIFKALALGARAVLVGRPYCWGLAVAGEQGVREVMINLLADFDVTLALSGVSSIHELNPTFLTQIHA